MQERGPRLKGCEALRRSEANSVASGDNQRSGINEVGRTKQPGEVARVHW